MAKIGQFNPNAQAPLESFIDIPKGEWNAKIVDSKIEGTDASNMKLVMTFEVDEGVCKGGKADVHLFLWSPEKKGEISRRKLTSIANAIGCFQEFNDSAILHGHPLTINTDIRFVAKQDGTGMMGFPDIKAFKKFVGRAAGADPVQPQAPASAPQSAAPSLPATPGFAGMPQAPAFAGMPAAPGFAPPQAPTGFAPPAPAQAPAFGGPPGGAFPAPGGFAPPQAPANAFAPPAAPGAFQPPSMGAPPPFGAPR